MRLFHKYFEENGYIVETEGNIETVSYKSGSPKVISNSCNIKSCQTHAKLRNYRSR